MKKLLLVFIGLSILLVGCSDESKSEPATKEQVLAEKIEKEEQETPTANLTVADATFIHKNIFGSLHRNWINLDLYLPVFENILEGNNAQIAIQKFIDEMPKFATERFLSSDYKQYLLETCVHCHEIPFYDHLYDVLAIDLKVLNANEFQLLVHTAETYNWQELKHTFHYMMDDGVWKIENKSSIPSSEGPKYEENFDEEEELPMSEYANALLEVHTTFTNKFMDRYETAEDMSQAEFSDYVYGLLEEIKAERVKIEERVLEIDPYYTISQENYNDITNRKIKFAEEYNSGGSGQGHFMLEAELQVELDRISNAIYSYREDL